jgi:hypothetical protein
VLPNVGPYVYMTLKFLALQRAQYVYDISKIRVKEKFVFHVHCYIVRSYGRGSVERKSAAS